MGLAVVALLALVGQNTMLLAGNQKLDDTTVATDVAYSVLDDLASTIQANPASVFLHDDPTSPVPVIGTGALTVGNTDYLYEVFITDVTDTASGEAVGSGPTGNHSTKLKKMEIQVDWWGGGQRQHSGNTSLRVTRLLKVTNG